jgi:hypothetical protein
MNSLTTLNNQEDVAWHLSSLGMLISTTVERDRNYIDLEMFLIKSTKFLFNDLRLSRSMEYWCLAYGRFLSFKKLNQYLSNIDSRHYDSAVLGALLSIADSKFPEKGKFSKLSKFCSSNEVPVKLSKLFSSKKKSDPRWLKYGVIAPIFIANEIENNLCYKSYLVKNVPEIYYRIIGLPSAIADIKSILRFNKEISIYKLAKMANLTYATAFNHMKNYELVDIKPNNKEFIRV